MVPITATAKAILPTEQVDLFALAGGGVYFASYKVIDPSGTASGGVTAFGFHLGGGAALKVTPAASVGADVRYLFASGALSGDYTGKLHLNGLRFAADFQYRF
jgi:opacity protein-like surface antigen